MRRSGLISGMLIISIFAAEICGSGAGRGKDQGGAPAPSENKGRTGTYQVRTSFDGCNYYVSVPATYSDDNPAGLHVFFHGDASQNGAENFGRWRTHFLDPYNLIGINMQWMDGSGGGNTSTKIAATREAIAQVAADYKVVFGRGVVACHSAGGALLSRFLNESGGKKSARGPDWPFNHMALYGCIFSGSPTVAMPMSWCWCVGSVEWTHPAGLGGTGCNKMKGLFTGSLKGGVSDLFFKVVKDKAHGPITDEDVSVSAEAFGRSELAYAPFIYKPDFPEKELAEIVAAANGLELGRAVLALEKIVGKGGELTQRAGLLKQKLDARIAALFEVSGRLITDDPPLADYYAEIFLKQLKGHPREKELREVFVEARKKPEFRQALRAYALFVKNFGSFFAGAGKVDAKQKDTLALVIKDAGEKSQIGRMAGDYLQLIE